MKIKKSIILLIIFSSYFFLGWGRTGHQIINRSSTYSFNDEINFMVSWADFLAAHGSDADDRKGSDPTEGHKHYIDIDAFLNLPQQDQSIKILIHLLLSMVYRLSKIKEFFRGQY